MKTRLTNYLSCLFILLLPLNFSCHRKAEKNQVSEITKKCVEQLPAPDSAQIAKIKIAIHAKEKSHSLDTLFQRKAKYQGFNGSVLIAQKGVVLYKNAFGYSRLPNKDTLTLLSEFQLASISKTFTGVATLLLAQRNQLSLTDTVQKFIPKFPYHGITIQDLLSHRSGLPNYLYSFEDRHRANVYKPSNDSILKWFEQANPLPAPYGIPGKNFSYNNTNFMLLACIIERVAKISYPEFLQKNIFEPLGMSRTFVDTIAPSALLKNKTTGHDGTRRRERDFYDGVYGDKGIFSTVEDMYKWYTALQSGCLLNKQWLKEAFTPRSLEHRSRHNYGLGFRLMTDPDNMQKVHYVYHGGWWAGYSNMFWTDQEDDFVIIILSNRRSSSAYDIKPILDILEQGEQSELDMEGEE